MSSHFPSTPSRAGPLARRAGALCRRVLLMHGRRRRTVLAMAGVSTADYLLPVVPNESMAVALGILQPRRLLFVALAFAGASALGAALLGTLLLGLADDAQRWGLQNFGDDWRRITAYVQRFGPITMLLAAVFPSPPRAMVAATVLAGVPVAVVAGAVLVGKLGLYALVFGVVNRLPRWWLGARVRRRSARPWIRRIDRAAFRFLAWRRWLSTAAHLERTSS